MTGLQNRRTNTLPWAAQGTCACSFGVVRRVLVVLCSLVAALSIQASDTTTVKPHLLGFRDLRDGQVAIPGLGNAPGIDLERVQGYLRCMPADDSSYARPSFDVRSWPRLTKRDSLKGLDASVYWIRYHFRLDTNLNTDGLLVHLVHNGPLDLWLDEVVG